MHVVVEHICVKWIYCAIVGMEVKVAGWAHSCWRISRSKERIRIIRISFQNQTLHINFKNNDLHFVDDAHSKYFKIATKRKCSWFIFVNAIAKSHSFIFSLIKSFTSRSASMSKNFEAYHFLSGI